MVWRHKVVGVVRVVGKVVGVGEEVVVIRGGSSRKMSESSRGRISNGSRSRIRSRISGSSRGR